MRLSQLQLIRYGKFDGQTVDFPSSDRDFHFIIGPNEAGKSTLRNAIGDLFFGIKHLSKFGFQHSLSELRLGALIQTADEQLSFERAKANKQSLRSPDDKPLADESLVAYLGNADRTFFEKMYGLDHKELVEGGKQIVNAASDVGQMLFQSAAGVNGLGKVREALEAEATALWAPTKSKTRAYYQAQALLDEATTRLKDASVRTKAWSDAQSAVNQAQIAVDDARKTYAELERVRSKLERVRRISGSVRSLIENRDELERLGEVLVLQPDAAAVLRSAQSNLAGASIVLASRQRDLNDQQQALAAIQLDDTVLAHRVGIEGLQALRLQFRNHAVDIGLRQQEIDALLNQVRVNCRQLTWPTDLENLATFLPGQLMLQGVSDLIREHGAINEAVASANKNLNEKKTDLERLQSSLRDAAPKPVPYALVSALEQAQTLRNTKQNQQRLQSGLTNAQRTLQTAIQSLGAWQRTPDELRALVPMSDAALESLRTQRQKLAAQLENATYRLREAADKVEASTLAVRQYAQAHQVVTPVQVQFARSKRDATWKNIKTGSTSVESAAALLDGQISHADLLVDGQLRSVADSAELQSLQHQLEREQAEQTTWQKHHARAQQDLEEFDENWATTTRQMGLDRLPLVEFSTWQFRRAEVLSAAQILEEKQRELNAERQAADGAAIALRSALSGLGEVIAEDIDIDLLCAAAQAFKETQEAASARRSGLVQQLAEVQKALAVSEQARLTAQEKLDKWQAKWQTALEATHLSPFGDSVGHAERALQCIGRITDDLNKANNIRLERINAMRADLESFDHEAKRLASVIDAELLGRASQDISLELELLLTKSLRAKDVFDQLSLQVHESRINLDLAKEELSRINARLAPLLKAAGVVNHDALVPLIEKSDLRRSLKDAIKSAQDAIAAQGDGLSEDQVLAEVQTTDLLGLSAHLAEVNSKLTDSVNLQSNLAAELSTAEQRLGAISGSADAATAEAQRQEALASMANAAERYIQVATAAKLLRWAINRYRDQKQGPMLQRASTIFEKITLGKFTRLKINYDTDPLEVLALRANGTSVGINGLSEGTCDQLYLALRLAALELHLEQAPALPFIADDLFVNFDNDRARAGLEALADLSRHTQVIFLSHHDHLLPMVRKVLGESACICRLS
jgi:uncharacterized protein YhaN